MGRSLKTSLLLRAFSAYSDRVRGGHVQEELEEEEESSEKEDRSWQQHEDKNFNYFKEVKESFSFPSMEEEILKVSNVLYLFDASPMNLPSVLGGHRCVQPELAESQSE